MKTSQINLNYMITFVWPRSTPALNYVKQLQQAIRFDHNI